MDDLTRFFHLLSDKTRLRIMVVLRKHKLCVCQLCGILEESQPKISKHLAKLRDTGIIKDEREEQFIFYSLSIENPAYLKILDDVLNNIDRYPELIKDLGRIDNIECYINKKR